MKRFVPLRIMPLLIAACLGFVFAIPAVSLAEPPVISDPVLASMSPGNGVSITVSGTGFWGGLFPQIVFSGALNLTITLDDVNDPSDPRIKKWTDNQILVDDLPETALRAQVKVQHYASGVWTASANAGLGFLYSWLNVPSSRNDGFPLAVAFGENPVDGDPTVWVNPEFHEKLHRLNLRTETNHFVVAGSNPVFEFTYDDDPEVNPPGAVDYAVTMSQYGEDVQVDENGSAWFTEGGGGYETPLVSPVANHSRIVRIDPAALSTPLVYNIPGDNNQITGLAFDSDPENVEPDRIWFSTVHRDPNGFNGYPGVFPAKLVSFHPKESSEAGISPMVNFDFSTAGLSCNKPSGDVGTCSNVPSRSCIHPADCVLADQLCASGTDCDLFREYPLPDDTVLAGHLVVDRRAGEKNVWYTRFFPKYPPGAPEQYNAGRLGRLRITSSGSTVEEYPLADIPARPPSELCNANPLYIQCWSWIIGSGPWQILKSSTGDIVFSEHFRPSISRFRTERVADPSDCLELDPIDGTNECIQVQPVPAAVPGVHYVHSLSYDKSDNLWFSLSFQYNDMRATLGYMKPDWTTFVMLPPLSAFEDGSLFTNPNIPCNAAVGENLGVMATGVATDPDLGDIWFGDFCRKRVGRIRDASTPYNSTWNVATNADDGYEEDIHLTPRKNPKLTTTTLKLGSGSGGNVRDMAALRVTSQAAASGTALTTHLTLPINTTAANHSATFRISVGIPNDSPFNSAIAGDISNRTKLATIEVNRVIPSGSTSIVFDNELTKLMDMAQRHPSWLPGQTNVVPFYIGRTDGYGFTLSVRSKEHSSGQSSSLAGVRGGS
jgi:hypothetical protein